MSHVWCVFCPQDFPVEQNCTGCNRSVGRVCTSPLKKWWNFSRRTLGLDNFVVVSSLWWIGKVIEVITGTKSLIVLCDQWSFYAFQYLKCNCDPSVSHLVFQLYLRWWFSGESHAVWHYSQSQQLPLKIQTPRCVEALQESICCLVPNCLSHQASSTSSWWGSEIHPVQLSNASGSFQLNDFTSHGWHHMG